MKISNYLVEDRKITVYDEIFNQQEINDIYYQISQRPYLRCNLDDVLYHNHHSDIKFSSEIALSEPLSSILLKKYSQSISELADPSKVEVIRHYVNYASDNTVDLIHEDCRMNKNNFYTILQYGNFVWDSNWHGETVFYNSNLDEILFSSVLKPGRIIVFDSRIPHSARPPSKIAIYPRYTIATKISIAEHKD